MTNVRQWLYLGWTNLSSGHGWHVLHLSSQSFQYLALVLMSHNESGFAFSFRVELLVSVLKKHSWSKPEFKSSSLSFTQKCWASHSCFVSALVQKLEILSEPLNDVLVLCFCALLCTKCFLNAFSIHGRAIKSFQRLFPGAQWLSVLADGLADWLLSSLTSGGDSESVFHVGSAGSTG